MPMKVDYINGRELKEGDNFIPAGEKSSIYKVVKIDVSKPGKHGSAKSLITAKNIVNGKTFTNTYLDSSEKVSVIRDPGYTYKVVYEKNSTDIVTNVETDEHICIPWFSNEDQQRIESEFAKFPAIGGRHVNSEGSPLVIKYSSLVDTENQLLFWEFLYVKPDDLQKYGITNYIEY